MTEFVVISVGCHFFIMNTLTNFARSLQIILMFLLFDVSRQPSFTANNRQTRERDRERVNSRVITLWARNPAVFGVKRGLWGRGRRVSVSAVLGVDLGKLPTKRAQDCSESSAERFWKIGRRNVHQTVAKIQFA